MVGGTVRYKAETLSSSIVVLGDFNPAIFSPDWLGRNGLIGEGDAADAREGAYGKEMIVSHQVSVCETGWFTLQVVEGQFSLISKSALSPAFKDLAVGILQLVPHTPVRAVGLNFMEHVRLFKIEDYYLLGDVLAPKEIWKELFPDDSLAIGLTDFTMQVVKGRRGELSDMVDQKRIMIQPSSQIKHGVFISFNDHHDVTKATEENQRTAEKAAVIVDDCWQSAWDDALRVFEGLFSRILRE